MLLPKLLAVICVPLASAQFTRVDFSGRKHSSVAVVGEYLFVHGGEPKQVNDTSNYETTILHLKDKWPASSPTQAPINWRETNGSVTTVRQMLGYQVWGYQLWKVTGSNSLLSWGGFRTSSQTSGSFDASMTLNRNIWTMETDANAIARWSPQSRPGGDEFTDDKKAGQWGPGWGYSVSCAGFGVYLGGLTSAGGGLSEDAGSSPFGGARDTGKFTAGMVTYDIAAKTFKREEVPAKVAAGAMAGGQAVCIPHLGKKGLIMFLGGYIAPEATELKSLKNGGGSTAVAFNQLIFYDPVDRTWATQKATGDIPESRSSFCAVGVKGKGGNFEVFVSGGDLSPDEGRDTPNIYMLSIPAMNWWRISQSGTPSSGHACEVIGKRHLVQVGGSLPPRANGQTSLPTTSGITLFDMNKLQTVTDFDPAAADYETPGLALTWYGDANNQKGVAWTDATTEAMLTGKTSDSSTHDQAGSGSSTSSSSPSTAVIAGAIVAAVVGVGIVGLAIFLLLRRRRGKNAGQPEKDESAAAARHAANGTTGAGMGVNHKAELDAMMSPGKSEMEALVPSTMGSPELDGATIARSELDSRTATPMVSSVAPSEMGGWSRYEASELYGSPIPEMDGTPVPDRGQHSVDMQKKLLGK